MAIPPYRCVGQIVYTIEAESDCPCPGPAGVPLCHPLNGFITRPDPRARTRCPLGRLTCQRHEVLVPSTNAVPRSRS